MPEPLVVEASIPTLQHLYAILAENHPDLLASQHNLAIAYQKNGQLLEAKAIKLLEHVVSVNKATLAEDHPARLISQRALETASEAIFSRVRRHRFSAMRVALGKER